MTLRGASVVIHVTLTTLAPLSATKRSAKPPFEEHGDAINGHF